MLSALSTYERFVYTIAERYPFIRQSTLVLIPHGPAFVELSGSLIFDGDVTLSIWEDIDFERRIIDGYSYAVNRGNERLYWYDPQPHPNNPDLATNHPHHKHVPPNIKRNRVIAPKLSFERENLSYLIEEIEELFP